MQRIGTEGSHGSNLVWRPLKAVGATLRALPFKHRFFRCRENNPQHRYNIKVAKHNTHRLNFKSTHLHLEVNECQQWGSMLMHGLCVLACMRKCSVPWWRHFYISGKWTNLVGIVFDSSCWPRILQHYWRTTCLWFAQIGINSRWSCGEFGLIQLLELKLTRECYPSSLQASFTH